MKGERGYVLVMSALLMLPLLAFAGFAVDVGSWYLYANRMQRAADAAALAGVVWMPNDERAEQVALETAKANGFDDAAADIAVTVTPVGNRRLRVNIVDTSVNMYFSKIFISSVDIQRQALAEYVQAVPMGSPDNTLGNDPDRWGTTGYTPPYYVLNVGSPLSTKVNGDRFTSGVCTSGVSGCSGATNLDYADFGYYFKVTVDSRPTSGDLNIQVFDPALTVAGNTCESSNLPQAGSTWTTQAAALVSAGTVPADAYNRYQRNQAHPQYCVADAAIPNSSNWDMDTSYVVREPDDTPFDNSDNPIICGKTFGSYNESVVGLLQSSTVRSPENMTFASHFRRWTTICTVPWNQVQVGDYLLQITSTASQSSPPSSLGNHDSTISTGGYNKYMLRAGWGTNPSAAGWNTGVNLFADGRLPIYVNQSDSSISSTFYLARIVPEYAGQMLEIELFDIGDGAGGSTAVDLTIVPPPDMTGSGLGTCTFFLDGTSGSTTSTTCRVTGLTSSTDQGKTRTVQIPLPDDYGCDAGSDYGCWFKIDIDFNGSNPTDQTTWSARVRGDPVRIVE